MESKFVDIEYLQYTRTNFYLISENPVKEKNDKISKILKFN